MDKRPVLSHYWGQCFLSSVFSLNSQKSWRGIKKQVCMNILELVILGVFEEAFCERGGEKVIKRFVRIFILPLLKEADFVSVISILKCFPFSVDENFHIYMYICCE